MGINLFGATDHRKGYPVIQPCSTTQLYFCFIGSDKTPISESRSEAMHKYRLLSKKGEGTFSEVLKAQSIKRLGEKELGAAFTPT